MSTIPTQIRIDSEIKLQANDLFSKIGLDMSRAVNLFLYQCVLRGGLPFAVELPQYSKNTIDAINEAKKISRDSDVKSYSTMAELKAALDD